MAITRIGKPAIADVRGVNFRNICQNGDMSIAQRGTSSTNVSTGYHTCDRYKIFRGAGTITMSQETDAPTGSGFVKSLKFLEAGSGSSPSAGDRNFLQHKMEGQNLQYIKKGTSSAEKLTLSFHVKSTVTGTYIAELYDEDNTRQVSKAYTISSANTWEYKTITFPADTSGTLDNDNANSMNINLYFTAGSNFTSGTLNTTWNSVTDANRAVGQVNVVASANGAIQWTGIQLEVGSQPSDFEFLPHDVNFERCARYFILIDTANSGSANTFVHNLGGVAGASSVAFFPYENFVPFRSAPSVSQSAVITVDEYFVANRTQSSTSIAMNAPSSKSGGVIKLSNFSSMTQGNGVQLSSGGTISLSAEL